MAGAMMTGKRLVLLGACLALGACSVLREAIYDRETPLAPLTAATLGATSRDDIVRQYGAPDEIDTRWFESFQAEVYVYLDNGDRGGSAQYRFLACEFSKGVLTAYAYHERLDEDAAGFDDKARGGLEKGKSTRQDVQRQLGPPQGRALLPTTINLQALQTKLGGAPFPLSKVPEDSAEVWQYYSQNFGLGLRKSGQKTLSVFFDAHGQYLGSALLQETVTKAAP